MIEVGCPTDYPLRYANKPDSFTLAAAYTAGIVKNHQFLDGNKRAGFVVGVIFLINNGYDFTASEESATQVVLSLAAGQWDETVLAAWSVKTPSAVPGNLLEPKMRVRSYSQREEKHADTRHQGYKESSTQ